ncbi:hypothetical protein T07_8828 [Trichinella nelsoni]|uniref:Uncharacterized protein n=1 Tax=Trichinella nelsoni TaxID=6336 RepID=A0A0V0RI43_9BILA|nr:hypothetical protein T07_8828 [Trichinella nelsoni]
MGPCGVVNYTLSQICLSVTYDATSDICFGFRRLFILPVSQWWNYHYFFNIHPLPSFSCPSVSKRLMFSSVWLFSRDEMENCRNTKNPPPSTSGRSVTSSAHRQQFRKFFKLGKTAASLSSQEDVHQGKQVHYDEFHHKSSPREITVDPPTLLDSVLLVTEKAKCKLCIYDRSVDGQSSIPAADRLQNRLLVLFKLGNI